MSTKELLPLHNVLYDAIVLDRSINEEELLLNFRERLTNYRDMSWDELDPFRTQSGFSIQESYFAVSFIEAFCDCYAPSKNYLDKITKQVVYWLNHRSVMAASTKESTNKNRQLGDIKNSRKLDLNMFKDEVTSLLKYKPIYQN